VSGALVASFFIAREPTRLKCGEGRGALRPSQRTKAALAAAKARGTKLGKPKGTAVPRSDIGRAHSVEANMANAEAFARRMGPVLAELDGLSARSTAAELEKRGYATARGGKWSPTLVIRTRARLGSLT
jgi:hypothetical protein